MPVYLWVALGGAVGSVARYGVSVGAVRWLGHNFPWGTLAVNILGSLVMGIITGLVATRLALPEHVRLFFTVGVLGGFTTFSSFSLDALMMIEQRNYGPALLYVMASLLLSFGAIFAGYGVTRALVS